MRRPIVTGLACLATVLPVAVISAPAHAATAEFTIWEVVDFTGGGNNTFTAEGLGDCDSGKFYDEVVAVAPRSNGFNITIRTVFACDNGDEIYALKHGHFTFETETAGTNTGPIQLLGGTGDFEDVRGHGVDNGQADFAAGEGSAVITGVLVGLGG